MEQIELPQDITQELIKILTQTPQAVLLLRGFAAGRDIKGTVALYGNLHLEVK